MASWKPFVAVALLSTLLACMPSSAHPLPSTPAAATQDPGPPLNTRHAILEPTDVDEVRLLEPLRLAVAQGWLLGRPDGNFAAADAVSRAELAAAADRFGGSRGTSRPGCFTDVPPGAWYAAAVCRLAGLGAVSGEGGTFRPAQPITRAEALKVLLHAAGYAPARSDAAWAVPYLAQARSLGVTVDDPDAPLTRYTLLLDLFQLFTAAERDAGRPTPSSGCRAPQAAPLSSFAVAGEARRVIVDLPAGGAASPQPLILAFHGRTNDNARVRRYFDLEAAQGIVAYPAAPAVPGGFNWWQQPGGPLLFDALLEALATTYCVDLGRVYAVGHSLGGSFVTELACVRAEHLRAVASVAGGRPYAECRGRVAALLIHNPADALVPVAEGEATLAILLEQNGHPPEGVPSEPGWLACRRYGPAEHRFPVLWCPHNAGRDPHGWPRGTGEAILAFFAGLDRLE